MPAAPSIPQDIDSYNRISISRRGISGSPGKWGFDTGYAIVRDRKDHQRAMTTWASYLPSQQEDERIPSSLVPELSRRARGLATWAVLKTLGRSGVSEMVGRHCVVAKHMASRLSSEEGVHVLNDVVLNQVIVEFSCSDDDGKTRKSLTQAVIDTAVETGNLFVGGARWRDNWVMRISVISYPTTIDHDRARRHRYRRDPGSLGEGSSARIEPVNRRACGSGY